MYKKLALILVIGLCLWASIPVFAQETMQIMILSTNDLHGAYAENADSVPEGEIAKTGSIGLAKIAAYVKQLEQKYPVLLLDAGDATHGDPFATLTSGESMIGLMNMVGYDGMVPGNHDFNYGWEKLVANGRLADFQIMSANVYHNETGVSILPEYRIYNLDGVKVAVFGLSTPETKVSAMPAFTEALTFEDPYLVAQMMANLLRPHVDVLVALTHLGDYEESEFSSVGLAKAVPLLDLIVDGHSHSELTGGVLIGNTMIVQSGSRSRNLSEVIITVEKTSDEFSIIKEKSANWLTFTDFAEIEPDMFTAAYIELIAGEIDALTATVIANTPIDLNGERADVRTKETALGNLSAEAFRTACDSQLALSNGGSIRATIPMGNITIKQILTSFPFENTIRKIEVTGQTLWDALELSVANYPETFGGFMQIAGFRMRFDPSAVAGSRIMDITINYAPIDLSKTYTLALADFVQTGGDGYSMFVGTQVLSECGTVSQAVIDYINNFGTDVGILDQRILLKE